MFKKIEKESFYYGSSVELMTTKDPNTNEDNITVISSTGKKLSVLQGQLGKELFLNTKPERDTLTARTSLN